jgi:flavin-dependent dehydrogenase
MTAGTVFLATGKHDLREQPRQSAINRSAGLKMYFSLSPAATAELAGATELTLFPGGYAGLQPVEDNQAALCIAVTQAALRDTPAWDALLAKIAAGCPRFAMLLQDARPLLPKPLAVAGVPYGFLHRADPGGVFRLGDQVAVIASLTGDGMAIALHSGQRAAETWLAGGDAAAYQAALIRTLAPQMRIASLLHRACTSNLMQAAAVTIASAFPPLLRLAATRTRLRAPVAVNPEPGRQSPRNCAVSAK